jgi:biopolymer transport protein ExbD
MPKVKIPRKSTNIDMKPPEVLTVKTPTSVSSTAAPEKSILITLTKDGKVFLMLGDDTKKNAIIDDFNTTRGLQLTGPELAKLKKAEYIGLPVNKLKSALDLAQEIPANLMDGIPVDSSNNELTYWMKSVTNAYKGEDQRKLQDMILVKGDSEALYPIFKNVKEAFKANELFKFRIVTEGETVPPGSELDKTGKVEKK